MKRYGIGCVVWLKKKSMKMGKIWDFSSFYDLHTSFQDLRRLAYVYFEFIYLFKVKQSNLIGQFSDKTPIRHKFVTCSEMSSRHIGGSLVPNCSKFHLHWRRVDSFPNCYKKNKLYF